MAALDVEVIVFSHYPALRDDAARTLAAPEVALLALLEVLFGVAWAWLGAGEKPSAAVIGGGIYYYRGGFGGSAGRQAAGQRRLLGRGQGLEDLVFRDLVSGERRTDAKGKRRTDGHDRGDCGQTPVS